MSEGKKFNYAALPADKAKRLMLIEKRIFDLRAMKAMADYLQVMEKLGKISEVQHAK